METVRETHSLTLRDGRQLTRHCAERVSGHGDGLSREVQWRVDGMWAAPAVVARVRRGLWELWRDRANTPGEALILTQLSADLGKAGDYTRHDAPYHQSKEQRQ